MKKLGEYLKSLREQKAIGLEDVAQSTKIHINKLRAIEDGDRDSLPAKVFTVGLIKSYGKELGADLEQLENLCQEAFELPVESVAAEPSLPTEEEPSLIETKSVGLFQVPIFVGLSASVVVIGLLIFTIVMVVQKMNSYSEEESLSNVVVTENTTLESLPPATDTENEATEPKKEELKIPAPKEPDQEKPQANKKIPKKYNEKKVEPINADEAQKPELSDATAVVVSDNKLILKALEPVRVEVIWSDGFVQVMLLKSQESKTLVFSSPIKVRVNNGGAIQVSFNDKDPEVPGLYDKPIELKFP